ncbi:MAG: hypothetical protein EBU90_02030 [Proteobacteria bacterium]|nr:hypothetical protein [Pseudomonadota bacterium]NBP13260.1 hypothetical protein [bacterium]
MNKTSDDPCYLQRKDIDNEKKLKFITTSHRDLLEAKDQMNFFGLHTRDSLFVPSESVDHDSNLKQSEMTNLKTRHGFGQLPVPTMPSKYQTAHGALETHPLQLYETQINHKACKPTEDKFHNRFWYIFDDNQGIETPRAERSIESELRCGKPTRFM